MTEEKKASILVADDLAGQRLILEMLLSVDGYDVTTVEDGKAALDFLKEHTPDLAILDVKMPFLTGIEVCDRMKRIPRLKHVPVVILTALRDDATLRRAWESQADEVIMKPLEGKDFRQTVKDLLAKGQAAEDQSE
ncbi:MAG: response regulator [Trueperaceae bacterium]